MSTDYSRLIFTKSYIFNHETVSLENVKPYLTKKFIARTFLVVGGILLFPSLVSYVILGFLSGPFSALWILVIICSLLVNGRQPAEPDLAQQRTIFGRVLAGIVIYLALTSITYGFTILVAMIMGSR
jgi:hypothetical protein